MKPLIIAGMLMLACGCKTTDTAIKYGEKVYEYIPKSPYNAADMTFFRCVKVKVWIMSPLKDSEP